MCHASIVHNKRVSYVFLQTFLIGWLYNRTHRMFYKCHVSSRMHCNGTAHNISDREKLRRICTAALLLFFSKYHTWECEMAEHQQEWIIYWNIQHNWTLQRQSSDVKPSFTRKRLSAHIRPEWEGPGNLYMCCWQTLYKTCSPPGQR